MRGAARAAPRVFARLPEFRCQVRLLFIVDGLAHAACDFGRVLINRECRAAFESVRTGDDHANVAVEWVGRNPSLVEVRLMPAARDHSPRREFPSFSSRPDQCATRAWRAAAVWCPAAVRAHAAVRKGALGQQSCSKLSRRFAGIYGA